MSTDRPLPALIVYLGLVALNPAWSGPCLAEGPGTPKGYVCSRASTAPVVDGKLDDPAWRDAPWTDDFVDIEGDRRPPPRFRTRAKMTWDDSYFYVAAEIDEPHVWGTIKDHDAVIFQDNDFEVFIDPDGDNHEYYEFEINALNTGWDLFLKKPYRDGGPAENAWEIPGLKTAVSVDGSLNDPTDKDRGWTVELAFPWVVLGQYAHRASPPRDGDQWRVNFSRVEWRHFLEGNAYKKVAGRKEDNWVWSPQGVVDMHQPEHWGYVQFSTRPSGNATYQPDPSAPIRDRLIEIYHAQKRYREKHKVWAGSLEALEFPGVPPIPGASEARLRLVGSDGFEAVIGTEAGDSRTWSIREDSRLSTVKREAPGK